jgi:hypothetical protein
MTVNQRFSVTDDGYVFDRLTSKVGKAVCFEGDSENDAYLRERMLWGCLAELTERLIVNTAPLESSPDGQLYQPFCAERHSICVALYSAITASHLNTLEVGLSLKRKFDGKLKRKKIGMQDYTSLSLFVDDVECLLRDLYGESDDQAIELVRSAVLTIVYEFTNYLRKDLWQEHGDAKDIDYVFGIGLPDGYGIHGSDHRQMRRAAQDLVERARAVRANPTAFSQYTVSFVDDLYENWPPLTRAPNNATAMEEDTLPWFEPDEERGGAERTCS